MKMGTVDADHCAPPKCGRYLFFQTQMRPGDLRWNDFGAIELHERFVYPRPCKTSFHQLVKVECNKS